MTSVHCQSSPPPTPPPHPQLPGLTSIYVVVATVVLSAPIVLVR